MWDKRSNRADRPRRIALLAGSYDRQRDGISVYIENLLVALLAETDRDPAAAVSVEVFGCGDAVEVLRRVVTRHAPDAGEHVRLIFHRVNGEGGFAKTAGLSWRVLREGPFDAVVLPNLQPLPLPGRKIGILHDLTYQVAKRHFSRRRFLYMHWLTRLRLRSDDAMGVISQTTRMHLLQHYPEAWHKRLLYLPNGLPRTKLGPRPAREAVHAKVRAQPLQMVFCGRLNRLKGVDRLLAFAERLDRAYQTQDGPAPILHLVGKATAETEALLAGTRFRRVRIERYGFLDDDALNRLYRDSGFALFLSRNEGFGLPLVEAIWMGAVPLVSDIPIFAEVLGAAYPRFGDGDADLRAMVDFVERVRHDDVYRERLLEQLEEVLGAHRDGYRRTARTLLEYAAETPRPEAVPALSE